MKRLLLNRSIGELLVLMIAVTVCVSILAGGLAVTVTELIRPESDTHEIVSALIRVLNTLVGVMAGYLAGRTDVLHTQQRQHRQEREPDDAQVRR